MLFLDIDLNIRLNFDLTHSTISVTCLFFNCCTFTNYLWLSLALVIKKKFRNFPECSSVLLSTKFIPLLSQYFKRFHSWSSRYHNLSLKDLAFHWQTIYLDSYHFKTFSDNKICQSSILLNIEWSFFTIFCYRFQIFNISWKNIMGIHHGANHL